MTASQEMPAPGTSTSVVSTWPVPGRTISVSVMPCHSAPRCSTPPPVAENYADISYGPFNLFTNAAFMAGPGMLLIGIAAWYAGVLGTARTLW